jgi:hypothetical protein
MSTIPSPKGLRAVYAFDKNGETETHIFPVLCLAHVQLPNGRTAVGGMSIHPQHPSAITLSQTCDDFVRFLNPGESEDDIPTQVLEFMQARREGKCFGCGGSHPKRRRRKRE